MLPNRLICNEDHYHRTYFNRNKNVEQASDICSESGTNVFKNPVKFQCLNGQHF